MNASENLKEYKFKKIGQYQLIEEQIVCKYEVKKTQRLSLVYAFVIGDDIKYFGKSTQGYVRPLSYHKNDVMKTVRNGILTHCSSVQEISVYARTEDLIIEFEGLELNIIESLEQALIKKYKPEWNNHIQK